MKTFLIFLILLKYNCADIDFHSVNKDKENRVQSTSNGKIHHEVSEKKIYEKLLRTKRVEQSSAVKGLATVDDPKQQQSALKILLEKIKKVLSNGKTAIEISKISLNTGQLPSDVQLRDQVSLVVENTAFLAEFALYFPDWVRRIFNKDQNFKTVYEWSFNFSRQLSLYDQKTEEMLSLAGQELLILPRLSNFTNPYWKKVGRTEISRAAMEEIEKVKEEKRKMKALDSKLKKEKRGPKLSHNEL